MQLLKNLALLLTIILISQNFAFANPTTAAMKLGDLLLDSKLFQEVLIKEGISKTDAIKLSRYSKVALDSLGISDSKQFDQYLKALNDPTFDMGVKIKMIGLISKKNSEVSKDEMITTLSNLYYLAGRHGKRGAFFAVCAACTKDSTISGLDFILEEIKSGTSESLLKKIIETKDAKVLSRDLTQTLSKFGAKASDLDPVDERPLAMFIEIGKSGSPAQKAYHKAVMDLSSTGKNQYGDLLEHRLWNNLDYFDNSEILPDWTKLINDVATTRKNTPNMSVEEAWEATLKKRANGDPDKLEKISRMKVKNCFMKKK